MTTKDELRSQAKAAIRPWKHTNDKPPFSEAQLLVIALILSEGAVTDGEIFKWIAEVFRYYRVLTIHAAWSGGLLVDDPYREFRSFKDGLCDAIQRFEMPLESHYEQDLGAWTASLASLTEATNFLKGAFGLQSSKKVNFFCLPAELRSTIYELVFGYPQSGLQIDYSDYTRRRKHAPGARIRLNTRSYDTPFNLAEWSVASIYGDPAVVEYPNAQLKTEPIEQILAPLLTCRQFYKEAMPTFYRINHFCFKSLDHLHAFLHYSAPERRKHLGHVSVAYLPENVYIAPQALKLLAQAEHLQKLNFLFDEEGWLEWGRTKSSKKYTRLDGVPGLATLNTMRGLDEVNFVGPCPTIEHMFKKDMLKPKVEDKASGMAKKRKAGEIEEKVPKKRKAKRAKAN